jgi:hypothetical protein
MRGRASLYVTIANISKLGFRIGIQDYNSFSNDNYTNTFFGKKNSLFNTAWHLLWCSCFSLRWVSAIAGSLFGDDGSKKVYISASIVHSYFQKLVHIKQIY